MPSVDDNPVSPPAFSRPVAEAAHGARPPSSTYRLQLTPAFGFDAARGVIPYLRSLGVGALYLSPILAPRPGSTHGYDVVDFGRINPELGGAPAFEALAVAAESAGLLLLIDFVPNHMGTGPANPWWWDLLENGPSSVHADSFDVDWYPLKVELTGKVLLPVLGGQYGEVLERGELVVRAPLRSAHVREALRVVDQGPGGAHARAHVPARRPADEQAPAVHLMADPLERR